MSPHPASSKTRSTSPTGSASTSRPKATRWTSWATATRRWRDLLERRDALRRGGARRHAARPRRVRGGRALRDAGEYVPILMLTARGRPEDVLAGFEAGADDYLPKPFELAILLARVRGLLRRSSGRGRRRTRRGRRPRRRRRGADVRRQHARPRALELRVGDRAYHLTVMECDLLAYLVRNAGQAVSRKAILEDVWELHEDTDTRAIDNFIVRLRRYLEERSGAAGAAADRARRRVADRADYRRSRKLQRATATREVESRRRQHSMAVLKGSSQSSFVLYRRLNHTNAVFCVARKLSSSPAISVGARRAPAARRRALEVAPASPAPAATAWSPCRGRAAASCAAGAR